jgi:hypothetical protein
MFLFAISIRTQAAAHKDITEQKGLAFERPANENASRVYHKCDSRSIGAPFDNFNVGAGVGLLN